MATQIDEIWIGEDNNKRKLEGAELQAFIEDRKAIQETEEKRELAEKNALAAKEVAHAKLAALGLTLDDLKALGL
jgi:hypothetical protein